MRGRGSSPRIQQRPRRGEGGELHHHRGTPTLQTRLAELQAEHRALDEAILRLMEGPFVDQLRLTRLKKRKLQLKDTIARLESRLIPDLDA
ncbi:hypothetical protein CKO33_09920 [Ectothiorhodospira mobilis]|nr:hypothetical protein [Ectothiorhodospira mobilis]